MAFEGFWLVQSFLLFLKTAEVSQKLTVLIAATISLWRFLMGFASYVANPIKYTPTCLSTPTKTGKLQVKQKPSMNQ